MIVGALLSILSHGCPCPNVKCPWESWLRLTTRVYRRERFSPAKLSDSFWDSGRLASLASFSKLCTSHVLKNIHKTHMDSLRYTVASLTTIHWVPRRQLLGKHTREFGVLLIETRPLLRAGRSQSWQSSNILGSLLTKSWLLKSHLGETLVGHPHNGSSHVHTPHFLSTSW